MSNNLIIVSLSALFLFISFQISAQPEVNWVFQLQDEVDEIIINEDNCPGYFITKKDQKFGLVNETGAQILPPEFDERISVSSQNWIMVRKANKGYVFNTKGKQINDGENMVRPYNEKLGIALKNGKSGLVDNEGNVLVPMEYDRYKVVGNDLVFEKENDFFTFPMEDKKEENPGYTVDKKQPLKGFTVIVANKKKGLINDKGEIVVPPEYYFRSIHPSGMIVASFDKKTYGIINTNNETLYPFTASWIGDWSNNKWVPIVEYGECGLYEFPGNKEIIPPGTYTKLESFSDENKWYIATKGDKSGLIDLDLNVVIPVEYKWIGKGVTRCVKLQVDNRQFRYFDTKSQFVSSNIYEYLGHLEDSLLIAVSGGQRQLVHAPTEEILFAFDTLNITKSRGYYIVHDKRNLEGGDYRKVLQGLYNRKGEVVEAIDTFRYYTFPDNSYFKEPGSFSTQTTSKHISATGEVLREYPKMSFALDKKRNWLVRKKSDTGEYTGCVFFYKDEPGQENCFWKTHTCNEGHFKAIGFDKKVGLYDKNGEQVLPPVFDEITEITNGLIPCKYNGHWGIVKLP